MRLVFCILYVLVQLYNIKGCSRKCYSLFCMLIEVIVPIEVIETIETIETIEVIVIIGF